MPRLTKLALYSYLSDGERTLTDSFLWTALLMLSNILSVQVASGFESGFR